MKEDKLRYITYLLLALLCGIVIVYLFAKYIFALLLPFLIAFGIATLMRPPSEFISKRTHIKIGVVRVILTLICVSGTFVALGLAVWQISNELWNFLSSITEGKSLSEFIEGYILSLDAFGFDFDVSEKIAAFIYDGLVSAVGSLAGFISSVAKAVPKALLALFVTLIASVYFALDLEKIIEAIKGILPKGAVRTLRNFKSGFFTVGIKYIRSYALLMLITFAIIFAGLLILRVQYSFVLSAIIAVLDILPIIGVGTVLIPWSLFCFVGGNSGLGIGLLVLYLANSIIRQSLEARLVGKNLGVHPIVSLVLIYLGYSLFGFVGIILVPIFTVIMNVYINNAKKKEIKELEH